MQYNSFPSHPFTSRFSAPYTGIHRSRTPRSANRSQRALIICELFALAARDPLDKFIDLPSTRPLSGLFMQAARARADKAHRGGKGGGGGGGRNSPFLFRMHFGQKCRIRRFQMKRYIRVFARGWLASVRRRAREPWSPRRSPSYGNLGHLRGTRIKTVNIPLEMSRYISTYAAFWNQ